MKYLYGLLFLITLCRLSSAQMTLVELRTKYSALGNSPPISENSDRILDNRFRGTKGTPYIQSNWRPGTVYLRSGQEKEHVFINYDVVEDQPIIRDERGNEVYISPIIVDHFTIQTEEVDRSFYQFEDPKGKDAYMFAEELVTGPYRLFVRRQRYFVPADVQNSAYNTQHFAEYRSLKEQFYILKPEDPQLYRLKTRRGKTLKFFQLHNPELKAYMDLHKIYGELEPKEMVDIVMFCNKSIAEE